MNADQRLLIDEWVATLARHSHYLTGPRLTVIELLLTSGRALTADQLLALALEQHAHVSRATIYRTLELLQGLHLVRRLVDEQGRKAYLRADWAIQPLATCEQCGDMLMMQSPLLERVLVELRQNSGFEVHAHSLQLTGICQSCRP